MTIDTPGEPQVVLGFALSDEINSGWLVITSSGRIFQQANVLQFYPGSNHFLAALLARVEE